MRLKNPKIYPTAKLVYRENISLGTNVTIDDFVLIIANKPITVGNFVHIASFSSITGGEVLVIGDYSTISSGVRILTGTEDIYGESLLGAAIPGEFRMAYRAPTYIGKHCMVGANSVVLPGVTIPEGVVIGACSFVQKDTVLDPWTVYAGCPVRVVGHRDENVALLLAKRLENSIEEIT